MDLPKPAVPMPMAGLRINNQKNAIAVTMLIATAFQNLYKPQKKWALESPADESLFFDF
jgi:hypothetical protein